MISVEVYLAEGFRWYVLIALLAAAAGKSLRFTDFRDSLAESFPLLKRRGSLFAAVAVVLGEWSAALMMLAGGALSRIGLILAFGLFVLLTAIIALVLAKGLSVRCNCFGASQQRISGYDFARNLLFIAAAGYALHGASVSGAAGTFGGIALSSSLALATVAISLFLLSINMREIVHLLRIRAEDL
jgi:hypothetical protein